MKLFSDSLPFYRANFHCHTTCSDGRVTPEECMSMYRSAGYDVLAITDHRKVTVPENIPDGLLMIPGTELDFLFPGQAVHIIGLGMAPEIASAWDRKGTPQQAVDTIRKLGGIAFLAHPAWSMNTPEMISSLQGIFGVEIWNSVSTLPLNADRADSSAILDVTWANGGRLLPVFANDDTHAYESEFSAAATMVQADSFTEHGILDALSQGRFYAAQGPRAPQIKQIEIEDGQVIVSCSPADTIIFYSNAVWVAGRARTGSGMTRSVYDIAPNDRYVRVEIRDSEGRKAWSAPVAVN